uniref:Uncharacterized protein n=1 Tax=Romanomermis culicivorax TaxID=13658 RepID=A0A915KNB7_ROMCU
MLSAPTVLRVLGPDVPRPALEFITNGTIQLLPAVNNAVNITEASPFPTATVPQSLKIGVLREVHPCGDLVIDFPTEEPVSSDDDDVKE